MICFPAYVMNQQYLVVLGVLMRGVIHRESVGQIAPLPTFIMKGL